MLTILHTESSTGWGGQENRTLQECIGLKKLGARAIILCQSESVLGKKALAEGAEVRTCAMRKSYDLSAIRYILKLIRTEKIDVISTHSGRDSLLAGLAGRLSGKKPRIVRTRHLALPITSRITYSLLPHKVVTVSEYVRQYLIKEGVSPEKVLAVPTGIDLTRFDPEKTVDGLRQELNLGQDVPIVGTIAILRYRKGHHILLDSIPLVAEKIPQAVFVFAGNGPQKENIINKIQSMGISDTLQEALGTSFLEAMAMGKPVIGTNVDGVGEVIENGRNGYLVEPNNPSALAETIIKALQDKDGAKTMGIEGRKMVRQNYTVEKMYKSMYALYSSLIEGEKP